MKRHLGVHPILKFTKETTFKVWFSCSLWRTKLFAKQCNAMQWKKKWYLLYMWKKLYVLLTGLPQRIKTDNAPTCISWTFKNICTQLKIIHHRGISYSPTGHTSVEKFHRWLKQGTEEQKVGENSLFPPIHSTSPYLYENYETVQKMISLAPEDRGIKP